MRCDECGGTIRKGVCNLCEMFKAGAAPRVVTDDTRFAGFTKVGGAQFKHDGVREAYLAEAKKAGVDVSGKMYFSELAAYPGDPTAWADSQGDMRRILEDKGWSCDGDLKVKQEAVGRPKDIPIADDLVADLVESKLEEQLGPDFTEAKGKIVEQARDDVMNTHATPAHLRD